MKPFVVKLDLDLQDASSGCAIPTPALLKLWVRSAIGNRRRQAEVSLRIVDEAEMVELNGRYRGKQQPTNVLSFPADLPPAVKLPYLGDIVLCAAVVEREAREQGKALHDHWAHMLIHSTLHLLGFDHGDEAEAETMESMEIDLLNTLDIANPYLTNGLVNHG